MKNILNAIITIFVLFIGFSFLNDYRENPREIDIVEETGKYTHETLIKLKDGWNSAGEETVESDTLEVEK